MSAQQEKIEVVNGVPFVFDPELLKHERTTTICLTGGGTYTLSVKHLDNDPVVLLAGVTTADQPLYTLYGLGYTEITIVNDSGTTNASVSSSRY